MNRINILVNILVTLIVLTMVVLVITIRYKFVNYSEEVKIVVTKTLEKAYFEGQKDALNGDIRIRLNSDSIYVWTKSCWDESGKIPIYNPTREDSKK